MEKNHNNGINDINREVIFITFIFPNLSAKLPHRGKNKIADKTDDTLIIVNWKYVNLRSSKI